MANRLNYFTFLIFFLSLYLISFITYAEIIVNDDKGNIVRLSTPANRIISLAPHITETLFAAGAGDKIIGTVAYSDYPDAAKKLPRIGGYPSADLEKIISLKPDLVIAWPQGNNLKQVDKLAEFGIKVYMSEPLLPQDVARNIINFGKLSGTSELALKSANKYNKKLSSLKRTFSTKEKIRVFYQFWNKPIMTINGDHLISKIINLCGGINVFEKLHSAAPKVSVEAVIASKTNIILAGTKQDKVKEWTEEWSKWLPLAVKEKGTKIYFIDPDLLNRAGPRILQGADKLCHMLDTIRTAH